MEEKKEERKDLMGEALRAYGISRQYVLSSRMDGNEAVIVTVGGSKVRFKMGDKVAPLDASRIDGVVRKKMKPITGTKK